MTGFIPTKGLGGSGIIGSILASITNPLLIGAGYAPAVFRHDTLGDAASLFATVTNGADTEVTQWLDQSSNGHHAVAPNPAVGGSDNMLLTTFGGKPALRARSMTSPFGTTTAPARKGWLQKTTGFPTTTGWTKHILFAFATLATANVQNNSIFSNSTGTTGHTFRLAGTANILYQMGTVLSGTGNLSPAYTYPSVNNWCILSQTSDPTTLENKIFLNGNLILKSNIASYINDPSFGYGAVTSGGFYPADAYFRTAQVHAGVLTDADILTFCNAELVRWELASVHVDWVGDSITQGDYPGAGPLVKYQYKAQTLMSNLLTSGIQRVAAVSGWNYGRNGSTLANILSDAQATSGTLALQYGGAFSKPLNPASRRVFSVWGGTNDIAQNGVTPATAYDSLLTLVTAAKATGRYTDIAVWTSLPRYNNGTLTNFTATLFAYNDLIRAGMAPGGSLLAAGANKLIDVQTITEFNNTNSPVTTGVPGMGSYISDGGGPFTSLLFVPNPTPTNGFPSDSIHPTAYSNDLLANLFVTAMGF